MAAGATFLNDLAKLLFQNVDITGIGDAGGLRGSVAAGSVYLRFHTGAVVNGTDNEATYTGYVAKAIARTAAKWGVAAGVITNAAEEEGAECTAAPQTLTWASINSAAVGDGKVLWAKALPEPAVLQVGYRPYVPIGFIEITLG